LEASLIEAIARRVGPRLNPAATPTVLAHALERLGDWLDSPLGRSVSGGVEVRRSLDWTTAWPEIGTGPAFRGSIDLAFRDGRGAWRLVGLADAGVSAARERLRLILSARLAGDFGIGRVVEAWSVRLGPG